MKTTQQFCESVYHKYALELERQHEKQRVRLMFVQRSAAAAAVVTVAVGTSVFVFRTKDNKLPVGPDTSVSDSKNPVKQKVVSAQTMGLIADTTPFMVDVPPAGQIQYSGALKTALESETDETVLFRVALTFFGDEEANTAARESLTAKGLSVEDASFDIEGDCVVTVGRDELPQLINDSVGTRARLAPTARPEGYDRRLGDLAAIWLDTAGDVDTLHVVIHTAWNSNAAIPNADLFREDDLLALVDGLVLLPKPTPSSAEEAASAEFIAKVQQWKQNNQAIEDLGRSFLKQQVEALCTRNGITEKIDQYTQFSFPGDDSQDLPPLGDNFTWRGHLNTQASVDCVVTKAQLQQLAQDGGVRYIQTITETVTLH